MAGSAVDESHLALQDCHARKLVKMFEYKPVNLLEIALALVLGEVAILLANSLPGLINRLLGLG